MKLRPVAKLREKERRKEEQDKKRKRISKYFVRREWDELLYKQLNIKSNN